MKTKVVALILLCVVAFACTAALAMELEDIVFITEDSPPYSYIENGIPKGVVYEVLSAASDAVDASINISNVKMFPWVRGMYQAKTQSDVCLFATVRTPAREKLFKWAGPFVCYRCVLISRVGAMDVRDFADIKKYKISSPRNSYEHELLLNMGYPESMLDDASTAENVIVKMLHGRVDGIVLDDGAAYYLLKQKGFDLKDFEVNWVFEEGKGYFAFNKDVPDSAVERMQQGIDIIRSSGELCKIHMKYHVAQQCCIEYKQK